MTWGDVYLGCFLAGLVLGVLSLLASTSHLHLHLPHLHLHHGLPHVHAGHGLGGGRSGVPFINSGTLAIFLVWFGGTGYLLTEYSALWFVAGLTVSVFSGLGGAVMIFWIMSKLVKQEHPLDPADYRMVGVLGRVSSLIRPGGTGEIIFSQEGVRRGTAARSDDGTEIPKDTEVVVIRYEKGIAYVRRWEELEQDLPGKEKSAQA